MRGELRHHVRLRDEPLPGGRVHTVGQEHLHGDAAFRQLLLVEEDVGESPRSEQPDELVSRELGRGGGQPPHASCPTVSVTPLPRSTTVPEMTVVGSPWRSFCGALPGSTTIVPLRECRSVTTTLSPSTEIEAWLREMSCSS